MRRSQGSSPLTRGKLSLGQVEVAGRGLIPTHAGKTRHRRCLFRRCRAHPHSRGENSSARRAASARMGSSPLTRGKQQVDVSEADVLGLIPTHAGKTSEHAGGSLRGGAHPHSRGENPLTAASSAAADGSSPLTRGKLVVSLAVQPFDGLIPTHAGKTTARSTSSPPLRAHPHSRGENEGADKASTTGSGSSPLTRGKHTRREIARDEHRLIPTHAGKTASTRKARPLSRAHPHSRGENSRAPCTWRRIAGSSPLTRGKLEEATGLTRGRGLIPTHAGKTPARRGPPPA